MYRYFIRVNLKILICDNINLSVAVALSYHVFAKKNLAILSKQKPKNLTNYLQNVNIFCAILSLKNVPETRYQFTLIAV